MKWILCSFIVLFPLLAFSQVSVPLANRAEMRSEVYRLLGEDTTGTARVTDAIVNNAINIAQVQVAADFPAYEKFDTVEAAYVATWWSDMNVDLDRINWIALFSDDTMYTWQRIDPRAVYTGAQVADSHLHVKHYFDAHPVDDTAFTPRLFAVPPIVKDSGEIDSMLVAYYAIPSELTDDTTTTRIRYQFRDEVTTWAAHRLCFITEDWIRRAELKKEYNEAYFKYHPVPAGR